MGGKDLTEEECLDILHKRKDEALKAVNSEGMDALKYKKDIFTTDQLLKIAVNDTRVKDIYHAIGILNELAKIYEKENETSYWIYKRNVFPRPMHLIKMEIKDAT